MHVLIQHAQNLSHLTGLTWNRMPSGHATLTQTGCTATLTMLLLNMTQPFLLHTHTHAYEQREIQVNIPLYMCNDVMNNGSPAPLSVVKL